jgi:hypothetical protein
MSLVAAEAYETLLALYSTGEGSYNHGSTYAVYRPDQCGCRRLKAGDVGGCEKKRSYSEGIGGQVAKSL